MQLTIRELFEESKKLDFDFVKSNEHYLKFFYLMMGKKTCNCPRKPRVLSEEAFNEAYKLYLDFNNTLSDEFKNNLKIKLNTENLSLKNEEGLIIINF